MMESLRNFLTGRRLIFIVLLCAFPFVFLGTGSLASGFGGSFGTIAGEDVTAADIDLASNSAILKYKSVYGDEFEFDMLSDEVKSESIKQELIILKVLEAGARSLGFFNKNTLIEAKKGIVEIPRFQVDGMFNENVYQAQVNSMGHTKQSFIDLQTSLLASELYRSSLISTNFATKNEVYELASLLEMTTDINFTKISYEGLKSELVNTSEELIEFYNSNEILFFSEEERQFSYLVLDQTEYKNNVEIPKGYLESSYKEYLSQFDSAGQTRVSHIMIDKNNYASSIEAFDVMKMVENRLLIGDDFSDLASQFSEDFITKDNGGNLDILPEEFEKNIENLQINDYSNIIELEDTYHILKITEINKQDPLSEDQIKDELTNELIETESLALMNDDFNILEDLILNNNSLEEIAESINISVSKTQPYTKSNYDFYLTNFEIRDYVFSADSETNIPYAIELEDKVIVVSISTINEPVLKSFEQVAEQVADLLSEFKAKEKLSLIDNELQTIDGTEDQKVFIDAYQYITEDTFFNVKRDSMLLPQEVLREIFNNISGIKISVNANNGDQYIVQINNFDLPSEDEINIAMEKWTTFSQERLASIMQEIINDDVFESAQVNLKNFQL